MCGHGEKGALIMADQRRLTQRAVATALRELKFTGHLLVSLNACEVGAELDATKLPDPWTRTGELGFQWTWIKSAGGNQSSMHHFARMLSRVAPQIARAARNGERHGDQWLCDLVTRAWDATRDPAEPAGCWLPPPTAASSVFSSRTSPSATWAGGRGR